MSDFAFVHAPELWRYRLAEGHPFKPQRLELTRTLLQEAGLLHDEEVLPPEPLAERELEAVHSDDYIAMVKLVSDGEQRDEAYAYGLGTGDNPVYRGMHQAVLRVCAATATAVELVASGRCRRAASFAGGLHHAQRAKASGFCVYNDLAVAMAGAVRRHGLRIAYLDLDAHHGDGVQWLFYESGAVMTVSLHESGRYLFPGTGHTYECGKDQGRGLSVNVPLEPFTEDESFLECFDLVVPRALRVFRPEMIVLQAGADMHRHDPLADLALTLTGMRSAFDRVVALAEELCDGRLVVTGGGGYDPYRTVPRAWAQLWAALTGRRLPTRLPAEWRERWQEEAPFDLPVLALDGPDDFQAVARRQAIASHNRSVARRLLAALEPVWAERGMSG